MRNHVQGALVIAAMLYFAWGLSLLVAPQPMHALLSSEPLNAATTSMFTAGLFAFVTVFLIAAHRPERETMHAAVAGLLFYGLVAGYNVFIAGAMKTNVWTVSSVVVAVALAAYVLLGLTEAAMNLEAGGKRARRPAPVRRRKARRAARA